MGEGQSKEKPVDLTDMCIELRMASKSISREANGELKKEEQAKKKVADVIGKE